MFMRNNTGTPVDLSTPAADLQWISVYVLASCRDGCDGSPTWLFWQWPESEKSTKRSISFVQITMWLRLYTLRSEISGNKRNYHSIPNFQAHSYWLWSTSREACGFRVRERCERAHGLRRVCKDTRPTYESSHAHFVHRLVLQRQ